MGRRELAFFTFFFFFTISLLFTRPIFLLIFLFFGSSSPSPFFLFPFSRGQEDGKGLAVGSLW